MNKKGFTLVELLAVIAILAILVIMALPAVLRMYRQSRINTFQNEVRSIYRTAQSQFLADSMLLGSGQTIAYTNAGASAIDDENLRYVNAYEYNYEFDSNYHEYGKCGSGSGEG